MNQLDVLPEPWADYADAAVAYAFKRCARRNRRVQAFTDGDLRSYAVERLLVYTREQRINPPSECLGCGKPVDSSGTTKWRWYCGRSCRQRAWRQGKPIPEHEHDCDAAAFWSWRQNAAIRNLSAYIQGYLNRDVWRYAIRLMDARVTPVEAQHLDKASDVLPRLVQGNEGSATTVHDKYPILQAVHVHGRSAAAVAAELGLTQDEYDARYEQEMNDFKDWAVRNRRVSTRNADDL